MRVSHACRGVACARTHARGRWWLRAPAPVVCGVRATAEALPVLPTRLPPSAAGATCADDTAARAHEWVRRAAAHTADATPVATTPMCRRRRAPGVVVQHSGWLGCVCARVRAPSCAHARGLRLTPHDRVRAHTPQRTSVCALSCAQTHQHATRCVRIEVCGWERTHLCNRGHTCGTPQTHACTSTRARTHTCPVRCV